MDEFEIKAIASDGTERIWTRNRLTTSVSICIGAVRALKYTYACVSNIHGGNVSDPLFECGERK